MVPLSPMKSNAVPPPCLISAWAMVLSLFVLIWTPAQPPAESLMAPRTTFFSAVPLILSVPLTLSAVPSAKRSSTPGEMVSVLSKVRSSVRWMGAPVAEIVRSSESVV